MFGRAPRLPIDLFLGISSENVCSTAKSIRQNLEAAYKVASEMAKRAQVGQAKGYNQKVRSSKLDVGDFVLVKNVNIRGKHKLADKWLSELYYVSSQPNPDIPVYVVTSEAGSERVLHRNLLLPLVLPWPRERDSDFDDVRVDDDISVCSINDSVSDIEVHVNLDDLQPESQVTDDFLNNVTHDQGVNDFEILDDRVGNVDNEILNVDLPVADVDTVDPVQPELPEEPSVELPRS